MKPLLNGTYIGANFSLNTPTPIVLNTFCSNEQNAPLLKTSIYKRESY